MTFCQTNSTLTDLQLIGNNIPDDIMQSIGQEEFSLLSSYNRFFYLANALAKTSEQRQLHFDHSQNLSSLSRQLHNVHEEKDRQISSAMTRITLQEQSMLKTNR